ncbi:hypothetical protein KKC22_04660 [Myxococcota bacterium]|nr:hypothetical protein [Myxococcota bacterium]
MARPPRFCIEPPVRPWKFWSWGYGGDEAYRYVVTDEMSRDYWRARRDSLRVINPITDLAAHRARVLACTELMRVKTWSLPGHDAADGGHWVLQAGLGSGAPVFAALRLDAFDEGRVIRIGDGGKLDNGGDEAGGTSGHPGGRALGRLVLGRDPRGLPLFSLFSVAEHADLTGAAQRCEDSGGGRLRLFPRLNRIDGYPELCALWLGHDFGECTLLVVTRNPAAALRRLRRWIFPARLGSFERAMDLQQRITWRSPARQWASYRLRRDLTGTPDSSRRRTVRSVIERLMNEPDGFQSGSDFAEPSFMPVSSSKPEPTLHQLALQRLMDPTALLPSLDTARPWTRPQTQTPALGLTVHAAIALRVNSLLLLRTFASDDKRLESSYRYRAEDFKREEINETQVWQTAGRTFPVLETVEPAGYPADVRLGNDSVNLNRLQQLGPDWDDDQLEFYLEHLAEVVEKASFVNDGPPREGIWMDQRQARRQWMLSQELTAIGYHGTVQPRRLEEPRVAEWIVRCSQLDFLPQLERECLFLSFVFSLRWEGTDVPEVHQGVLQVRVPLAVAWHGLDLSGLFTARSCGFFVATGEAGVLACLRDPGGRERAVRLELGHVYPLDGFSALSPEALFREELPAPELIGTPPKVCVFGPVSHLIVTGHPDLRLLRRLLPPISGVVEL